MWNFLFAIAFNYYNKNLFKKVQNWIWPSIDPKYLFLNIYGHSWMLFTVQNTVRREFCIFIQHKVTSSKSVAVIWNLSIDFSRSQGILQWVKQKNICQTEEHNTTLKYTQHTQIHTKFKCRINIITYGICMYVSMMYGALHLKEGSMIFGACTMWRRSKTNVDCCRRLNKRQMLSLFPCESEYFSDDDDETLHQTTENPPDNHTHTRLLRRGTTAWRSPKFIFIFVVLAGTTSTKVKVTS